MKGVVYTEIKVIDGSFSVCKVTDFSEVDPSKKFNFIIDGWRALKIQGVLDFSLIGILSRILGLLAEAKIGIAAVSTYNTDYIFV